MSVNIPDITVDLQSDDEMSDDFENFYEQCDRLYNRVANYPVTPQYQCKKDSRYWLYKSRDKPKERVVPDGELTYDKVFSVIGHNGRRFKKDSRIWLHKTSVKAAKLKQLEHNAKMKRLERNSNCKTTISFHDDTGIDENSLTAMSNIVICSDPRCQESKECSKRCHEADVQDSNYGGGGYRNRKRRKLGYSLPASPAHNNESGFAIVSRSLDRNIGFSGCLNKMHGEILWTDSENSTDSQERSWKHERSPHRHREFQIVSSASSYSSHGITKKTAVSSDGSINLVPEPKHQSAPAVTAPDNCVHVKYTPKRKASVYDIVNEDFYDFISAPVQSPLMNVIDDPDDMDTRDDYEL